MKYRDGAVIRKCARGEANKVVAAAAQAAQAAAPPGPRRPQRASVAVDPSEVLHWSGVFVVDAPFGPLTATEAQAFHDIMGGLDAMDGSLAG